MQWIFKNAGSGGGWRAVMAAGCLWWVGGLPAQTGNDIVRQNWVELRTANFRAFSCAKTQELMAVVARLEQFRYSYSALAGTQAVASVPILVYAFGDDRALIPFKPLYQGKPKSVSAYFARGLEANFIALDLDNSDAASMQTIFHEYTHLLLRRNARYWPLWLEEGMAEVYSTYEVKGSDVLLGKPPEIWLRLLAHQPMIPLTRLFEIKHDAPEYNESERQGMFYAQSWLLAHYLVLGDNPAHRARFGQYTRLLRGGTDTVAAFTNAFGTGLPVMERELKSYVTRAKFEPVRLKINPQIVTRQPANWRPITPAETSFWLGRLLMQLSRTNDARQYFDLAARLQPRAPFGQAGLGLLAADEEKTQVAIQHLGQAVQLGSQDYQVYYELGRQRLELAITPSGMFRSLSEREAEQVRSPLKRALALMPACALAHNRLGLLEMIQGKDTDAAEQHLKTAAQLEPDNCNYVLMYGRLLVLLGKADQAREMLYETSRLGSHPKCQAQAKELLAMLPDAPVGSKNTPAKAK